MPRKSFSSKDSSSGFYLLPPPQIGDSSIGFTQFNLFDVTRTVRSKDSFNRLIEVLVWYPGSPCRKTRKGYLHGRDISQLRHLKYSFGRKTRRAIGNLKTNSFFETPVLDQKARYPIVLFSHDFAMLPEYYTILMEHLASWGYFVFSINTPYLSETYTPFGIDSIKKDVQKFSLKTFLRSEYLLSKARRKLIGKSQDEKCSPSRQLIYDWMDLQHYNHESNNDKIFLLSFLEELDRKTLRETSPFNIFYDRLDLNSLGVIGHGWGGAASVDLLMQDNRVNAAINLNGLQFSDVVNKTLTKPLCMIYEERNSGLNDGMYFSSGIIENYTIRGSSHQTFSDWLHYPQEGVHDSRPFYKTLEIIYDFFDRHVKSPFIGQLKQVNR